MLFAQKIDTSQEFLKRLDMSHFVGYFEKFRYAATFDIAN